MRLSFFISSCLRYYFSFCLSACFPPVLWSNYPSETPSPSLPDHTTSTQTMYWYCLTCFEQYYVPPSPFSSCCRHKYQEQDLISGPLAIGWLLVCPALQVTDTRTCLQLQLFCHYAFNVICSAHVREFGVTNFRSGCRWWVCWAPAGKSQRTVSN